MSIYILYMNLSMKEPSYGTILTWAKKIGFFELEIKKERHNDWIIILDESVEFGHDKLLVMYGISAAKANFESALNYCNLTPLSILMVSFTSNLTMEQVKTAMETVKNNDLKLWSQNNIGETNLQKRKRVLRKAG